jgi:hypothetical protein
MKKVIDILDNLFGGSAIGGILDKIFPDKAEKMKFELEMREQLYKSLELEFKEMESAREMQIEALKQNDTFSKRFVYYLSLGVLINSLLAGLLAFFVDYPELNKELVLMYYSFSFTVGGAQIMRFFFGNINHTNKN